MNVLIWSLVAVGGGLAAAIITARTVSRVLVPTPDLPSSPLQNRARWSLGLAAPVLLALVVLLMVAGPEATFDDGQLRALFFVLALTGMLALSGGVLQLRLQARSDAARLDELDRTILNLAPAVQALGTLVTLTLGTIGLVEQFYAAGTVPLPYLLLLFWSCVLMFFVGLPVGILVGYRSQ
jgi:hypothetical protein